MREGLRCLTELHEDGKRSREDGCYEKGAGDGWSAAEVNVPDPEKLEHSRRLDQVAVREYVPRQVPFEKANEKANASSSKQINTIKSQASMVTF